MGHFNTTTTIQGVNSYHTGGVGKFDYVFYVGFHADNSVPHQFLDDVVKTQTPVIWIHTGFAEFSRSHNLAKRFGFAVTHLDSTDGFTVIHSGGKSFSKDEPIIDLISISDRKRVEVLATAFSPTKHKEIPYIVRSGNFMYVGDSPFASAGPTDRYLLFADMLHDILHEPHEESHSALIRIEDVNPMENPQKLRDVADLLSDRGIPFLVGVIPFYVDPGEGLRISLSDKPEIVDALLNGEIFDTITEARVITEQWRNHYNTIRPHSSLGYRPPAPETHPVRQVANA